MALNRNAIHQIWIHILYRHGFAVAHYSVTLDALALKLPAFATLGFTVAV
jgi:hypothetical protein